MNTRGRTVWGVVALAAAFLAMPCVAALAEDEPPPPNIIQHWTLWPRAGHQAEFEKAIKAFVVWRKSAGEGLDWQAFTPVVGDDMTFYAFRAGPFHWKDLDAQAEWAQKSGVTAEYAAKVAMHVERAEHYLFSLDTAHTLWYDSDDYRYYGVTSLKLAPGTGRSVTAALDIIHKVAREKSWKPGYNVQWTIGGGDFDLTFVNPYRTYAEMASPETPFDKMMGDSLGSDDAAADILRRFWSSFERGHYMIVQPRPDLSTPR